MTKSETVRQSIMETASRLFYHQGYMLTGINQIVAEAGIAIGSLYHHFSSKTDLLLAYLQQEDQKWFDGFESISKTALSPESKLLRLCDYRIQLQEQALFAGCHFTKINAEIGNTAASVQELVEDHKERQRQLIRDLVKQARPGARNNRQLADTLFLLLEGGSIASTLYKNTWPLKQAKQSITALLKA